MATTKKTETPAQPKAATPASADQSQQGTHTVLDALHHDGKAYAIGAVITLTAEEAAALPAGVVAAVPASEAETAATKD